jgi:hypothetical protein
MILCSARSVAALLAQAAGPQLGRPQPAGTVPRLVLPSAERSVRWAALSRRRRRHDTADLIPDWATAAARAELETGIHDIPRRCCCV